MKKLVVKLLSLVAPQVVASYAYKILTNPQVRKLRPNELVVLNRADKKTIKFGEFDIQAYLWGDSKNEKILLVHGWEGQAGNFSDLISLLLEKEYFVISFDGPSHGYSSKGQTSLFEFSDLVALMLKTYQCKKLVSHSFGGVATTYALSRNQNIEIDKYALITTPDKFSQRIDAVADMVGISNTVKFLLISRLENDMNIKVDEIGVSNFVTKANVGRALIIHDKEDRVIPVSQSQNVARNWENCHLEEIEGTGHFRILRTNKVLDKVIEFMT